MARLSSVYDAGSIPSIDTKAPKNLDQDFFDRAVNTILSEEVGIKEPRDAMMDGNIDTLNSLGMDGTNDDPNRNARHGKKSKSKSPHFPTAPTSSSTTKTKSTSKSTQAIKNVAGEVWQEKDGNSMGLQDAAHRIHESHDNLPAPIQTTVLDEMPISDPDVIDELKIFGSVSEEKRLEVLEFIYKHPFPKAYVQPVLRADRRQFTQEVREFARNAGLDETTINDVIELVRKIYLGLRDLSVADYEGSAFGEEVDEEELSTETSHHKRRRSTSDHYEEKKHKKTKKRHSENHKRHSDDAVSHEDSNKAVDVQFVADASTDVQANDTLQADGSMSIPRRPPIQPQLRQSQGPKSSKGSQPKKSQKDKNKRKRERKKERNKQRTSLGTQTQTHEPSPGATEEQGLPLTSEESGHQRPNGNSPERDLDF